VDGSKKKGYGVALHQIDTNGVERPILFLSRTLSKHEKNYFATELEVGCLVWAISKLTYYLDGNQITIVTDHEATKGLVDAAVLGGKSTRLIRWGLFLSRYRPSIEIVYRPGKTHSNTDGLSRLPTVSGLPSRVDAAEEPRETTPETISGYSFVVDVVDMDEDLRKDIV